MVLKGEEGIVNEMELRNHSDTLVPIAAWDCKQTHSYVSPLLRPLQTALISNKVHLGP